MELQIDAIDRKLLRELQSDSRQSVQELGDAVTRAYEKFKS